MIVSAHAQERISERMGFRSATAIRIAENALNRGKSSSDLPFREAAYLQRQENKEGCIARFYNGCCFIFNSEGACITVYLAPKWFGKRTHYVKKERVRDYKKYAQRYAFCTDPSDENLMDEA